MLAATKMEFESFGGLMDRVERNILLRNTWVVKKAEWRIEGIRTPALCLEAFNQLFMFAAVFLSLRYVFLTERRGQCRRHRTSRMAHAVCSRSNGNASPVPNCPLKMILSMYPSS